VNEFEVIDVRSANRICVITLNRTGVLNRSNATPGLGLTSALVSVPVDAEARAVVLLSTALGESE
jgi:enoyl-CoA hydratase/carnithine racemase